MTGVPESARSLNQMPLKNNMRIVVLDGDIPAPNGSGFIDPLDIRPKKINWDVSTNAIPATAKDGDHLQVTVGGVFGGVTYAVDDGAYVLDKVANKLLPIPKTPAVGGGGSSTPVSGAVWVKSVVKGPTALGSYMTVTTQGLYSVKGISGNATQLSLTIAAIPGISSDTSVSVYAVPGTFTPSPSVPYPPGSPSAATGAVVDGNDTEIDNIQFTATISGITFASGQAQIVILHSGGAYCIIPYIQAAPPLLQEFDITSSYQTNQNAGGMIYDRTAFSSGETVPFSFLASADITAIAVWPADAQLGVGGIPTGTPVIIPVSGSSGNGTYVIPNTIETNPTNAVDLNKRVYAAAYQDGQYSTPIQMTTAFDYNNAPPSFSIDYYMGNTLSGFLVSIKDNMEAVVKFSSPTKGTNTSGFTSSITGISGEALEQLTPAGVDYFDKRIHTGDWVFHRNTAVAFEGLYTLTITAYNFANGKTSTQVTRINIEDLTVANPTLVVNNGNVITTSVGGKNIPVSVDTTVCMQSNGGTGLNVTTFTMAPTPHITRTTSTSTAISGILKTDVHGYQFDGEVKILDSAPRGTYTTVTDIQLRTNAGTDVNFVASYRISGFDERILYFAAAGSPYVNLVQNYAGKPIAVDSKVPQADYPAGLVVRDQTGTITFVNGVDYIYNPGPNRLEFQNTPTASAYFSSNTTGNMFVRVSQAPAP